MGLYSPVFTVICFEVSSLTQTISIPLGKLITVILLFATVIYEIVLLLWMFEKNCNFLAPGKGDSLTVGTGVLVSSNFLTPNNQTNFFKGPR